MIKLEDTTMTKKNAINRALVAKKYYNQPEVQIASVQLGAFVLAGSPAAPLGGSGAGKLNTGVATDEQW